MTDNVSLVGANVTITPSGNVLTISAAGGNFIQNTTTQQPGSNFNISGDGMAANLTAGSTLSGNVINAVTQFNIGGNRILSSAGEENIFAGLGAGVVNTTGSRNAFFGYNAGAANTTGRSNSFIGRQAGVGNITGINNTFVGSDAGTSNTTGNENQFVGASAGERNTVGNGNSFFGTSAGNMNTEGVANSFYGNGAGIRNTTGGRNTFFGSSAGSINTTGGYNTVVGANADVVTNNLSYATAIGAGARVSTSNTIALGRSDGSDRVRVFGLGAAGSTQLCRNAANEISTCSSSLRYKTSISPFSPGLNLLRRLRPIRFDWKEGGMKDVGFGAEDVADVEPLLVTYNAKGTVEGVKYDRISAVLVNAVKEQQMQIEAQQAQLKQQGAQIEGQQQQLRQQQVMIDGLKKLLCLQNVNAEICR